MHKLPVLVRKMNDDEAVILMVDSNNLPAQPRQVSESIFREIVFRKIRRLCEQGLQIQPLVITPYFLTGSLLGFDLSRKE